VLQPTEEEEEQEEEEDWMDGSYGDPAHEVQAEPPAGGEAAGGLAPCRDSPGCGQCPRAVCMQARARVRAPSHCALTVQRTA
jgi:hypothetical protein